MSYNPLNKVFDVIINGKKREVWRLKEKHKLGEWNGCPDDWWVNVSLTSEPQWEPWIDRGTNRPCWDIRVVSGNRSKIKWGDYQIRSTGMVTMACNQR